MKYKYPSTNLLDRIDSDNHFTDQIVLNDERERLISMLKSFKLTATIANVLATPFSVTYEILPASGVSIKAFRALHTEFEMTFGAEVEISSQGNLICIVKKNPNRPIIGLRGILESDEFQKNNYILPVAIGIDMSGQNLCIDLAATPHMLVAGTTGSGKTVFVDDILMSLVYSRTPDEVQLVIIDPKQCDFSIYNGIPHLISPVIYESEKAISSICAVEDEMMRRFTLFNKINVRDIDGYNRKAEESEKLPRIVFIIDEYMDLMMRAPAVMEDHISRITRLARAAGIHLILATQRPTAKVITPVIKANLPCRASFTTVDGRESRAILDSTGAQKLKGSGDMLFSASDTTVPIHAQAAYVNVDEIKNVVRFLSRT